MGYNISWYVTDTIIILGLSSVNELSECLGLLTCKVSFYKELKVAYLLRYCFLFLLWNSLLNFGNKQKEM